MKKILQALKNKIAWKWVVSFNITYLLLLVLIIPFKDFTLEGVLITLLVLSLFNGAAIYQIVSKELKAS